MSRRECDSRSGSFFGMASRLIQRQLPSELTLTFAQKRGSKNMNSSNIRSFLTVLFCGAIFQFGGSFYAQTSTTAPVSGTPKAFKTPDQEKTKVEKVKDAKNASDNPASTKPTPQAPTEGSLS